MINDNINNDINNDNINNDINNDIMIYLYTWAEKILKKV